MSENLRNYVKALYGFDAVVRRMPTDRWGAASPCEGWSARDVVCHAAGVVDAVAEQARTGQAVMPAQPDLGDDVVAGWSTSLDALLETLDHPGVINRAGTYWTGESTVDDLLGFTTWDPLVHAWDVATATGIEHHADPGLAARTLERLAAMEGFLRQARLMGDATEAPPGADAYVRLLAFTGREVAG